MCAQPADRPAPSEWTLQEDFDTAKRLIERALSDDFPNPIPVLRNRVFRVVRRMVGSRMAEALKRRYLALQALRGARRLARLDAQDGQAVTASASPLIREALMQGWIGQAHLLELARLSDELVQLKALSRIKAYRLSVDATRRLVDEERDAASRRHAGR